MAELRDKDVIKTAPLQVSQEFTLPKNLDEGSVVTLDPYDLNESEQNSDLISDDDVTVIGDIDAPTGLRIKSQKMRFAPDGTAVVDVILEFPDVKGATKYEVRLGT